MWMFTQQHQRFRNIHRNLIRTWQDDCTQAQYTYMYVPHINMVVTSVHRQLTSVSLDNIFSWCHFFPVDFCEVICFTHRSEMFLERWDEGDRTDRWTCTDQVFASDLNVSTLIETRESDRGDIANFVLFVEETFEDELSHSVCVGSCIEEIAEDHVLCELDSCTSCMPLVTRTDLDRWTEK